MVETRIMKKKLFAVGKRDGRKRAPTHSAHSSFHPTKKGDGQESDLYDNRIAAIEDSASDVQSDELNIGSSPRRAGHHIVVPPPPEHVPHPDGICARCQAKSTPCCGMSDRPCISCKKSRVKCTLTRTNKKQRKPPVPNRHIAPRPGEGQRRIQPARAVNYRLPRLSNVPGRLARMKGRRRRIDDMEIVRMLEDSAMALVQHAEVCMQAANAILFRR